MGRNTNEILMDTTPETSIPETSIPETSIPEAATPEGNIKNPNAEKLSIFVPRLPNSKNQPPLEGSINGKPFVLPRGKFSMVSPAVFEVVSRSLQNEIEAEEYYNSVNATLNERAEQEAANLK